MADVFTTCGKQVLSVGEHVADGGTIGWAETIARAMNAWAKVGAPEVELVEMLHDLRVGEMWAVMIHHDNPDEGPRCSITCEGEWVKGLPHENGLYPIKQFWGDTVLDCLRAAHTEMVAWRARNV